jgi:serine/threonine-protein kinase SRK2
MLDHPHVIRFKAVYTHQHYVCIIMEYANGGNLRSYLERIGRMVENQARFIFQQLVIAVDYCHQKGVTNRSGSCRLGPCRCQAHMRFVGGAGI